jgi:membrane protein
MWYRIIDRVRVRISDHCRVLDCPGGLRGPLEAAGLTLVAESSDGSLREYYPDLLTLDIGTPKLSMFASFRVPIAWSQVMIRTVNDVRDDHCLGLAAQLAFYFLLALFPALLFFVVLIGYLPVENALSELLAALATVAPRELLELLHGQLDQITEGSSASLVTLGILAALWSSSSAMVAIIDALNHAYDVAEWRPWWKRRLVAIVLTIALALFIIVSLAFILIGPTVASRVAESLRLAPVVAFMWRLVRWPLMIFCVVLGMDLVYHFAPNRRGRWEWITPGAALATTLWIVSSFAFKLYLTNFGHYAATYGAIGGAIVTMLWFYVSSIAILVGAEMNGVIEDAWRSVDA